MSAPTELSTYLKASNQELVAAAGPHLNQEDLLTYVQGQLPEAKMETCQMHLAYCPDCLQRWRDVRDFYAPPTTDEPEAGEFELRREWKQLWGRIQTAAPTDSTKSTSQSAPPLPFRFRSWIAIAACVPLLLGLGTITSFWRQERQQRIAAQAVTAQLQSNQQELLDRLAQLQQTPSKEPQMEEMLKQERAKTQELQMRVNELSQPQTNTEFYELPLASGTTRSEVQEKMPPIEINVRASAQSWLLKITPDKPDEFANYLIKILDLHNATKWESGKLTLDQGQSKVVTFRKDFLSQGKYQINIYGQHKSGAKLLGKYTLKLN